MMTMNQDIYFPSDNVMMTMNQDIYFPSDNVMALLLPGDKVYRGRQAAAAAWQVSGRDVQADAQVLEQGAKVATQLPAAQRPLREG